MLARDGLSRNFILKEGICGKARRKTEDVDGEIAGGVHAHGKGAAAYSQVQEIVVRVEKLCGLASFQTTFPLGMTDPAEKERQRAGTIEQKQCVRFRNRTAKERQRAVRPTERGLRSERGKTRGGGMPPPREKEKVSRGELSN